MQLAGCDDVVGSAQTVAYVDVETIELLVPIAADLKYSEWQSAYVSRVADHICKQTEIL